MFDDRLEITSPGKLPNIVARTTRRREALEDKLPKGALSKLNEYELALFA